MTRKEDYGDISIMKLICIKKIKYLIEGEGIMIYKDLNMAYG